jgi:hypothetical protein
MCNFSTSVTGPRPPKDRTFNHQQQQQNVIDGKFSHFRTCKSLAVLRKAQNEVLGTTYGICSPAND